jgi:chorismate mutase
MKPRGLPVAAVAGIAVSILSMSLLVTSASEGPVAQAAGPGPLAKLVDDAAQRLQTADPVAAAKYRTGGAVDDPAREREVIDAVTSAATAHNIDPDYVRDVFRNQIDATDSLEHSRFADWKIDPGAAPSEVPDLASSRDTIDRLNTDMVDDIADQWPALHARTCPADLASATAAAVSKEHLDALYQQALNYAVHGYCR